jgi:hypothetical protein
MNFKKNFDKKDNVTINRVEIIKQRHLKDCISNETTQDLQEAIRKFWEGIYNPFQGYKNIHHRSQKKKRILAKRHY